MARTVSMSLSGGQKLGPYLKKLAAKFGNGGVVRVGFLEGATYPATDPAEQRKRFERARETGPRRAVAGDFGLPGRQSLVGNSKRSQGIRKAIPEDFGMTAATLPVAQVAWWNNFGTSRSKPRPFFSNTVREQSPTWGGKLATAVKATNFDTGKALAILGTDIKDKLVQSIAEWPADNADFTVRMKGFNAGLKDKGIMQRNVDFEVSE